MSRWEYMRRLEELLSDIPPGEREEALQYYNDYINDSGKENEAEVLASLGTPEQVAVTIKEGLEGAGGEFTEKGFQGASDQNANTLSRYREPVAEPQAAKEAPTESKKPGLSGGLIALIVVLCIFGSPVIIGAAGSVLGFVISCFAIFFALIFGFGVSSLVLLALAIFLVVTGIIQLVYNPMIGLALIAAAFIVAGLGILFLLLTVLIAGKLVPAVFKGIGYIFNRIFGKKGATN